MSLPMWFLTGAQRSLRPILRDIDIRRALLEAVREAHADERDTRYVEELSICGGQSVADLAVVNGSLHCYEIKSQRDSLARLPGQRASYDRVFDFVTVVAYESHAKRIVADEMVPHWWGLIIARDHDGVVLLEHQREAKRNPAVERFALAQFLWRTEVMSALEQLDLARGRRRSGKAHLWRVLAEALEVHELGVVVREALKARQDWRVDTPRGSCGD
jgi:hypothetical protein